MSKQGNQLNGYYGNPDFELTGSSKMSPSQAWTFSGQKPNTKTTNQNLKITFQNRVYLYTLRSLKLIGSISTKEDSVIKIIINQLIRSLTSIGANIIEAKASNSKKDFARYFDIALKSANETKYWLYLLRDLDKADKTKIQEMINETNEISNILASSLLTMRKKKDI